MLHRRAFLRRAAAMAAVLGLDPTRLLQAETPIAPSILPLNPTRSVQRGPHVEYLEPRFGV